MTKVILSGPCIGKTYADLKYKNIYDFDKHTLDYRWDRTGHEHLSNEEFKGIANRVENDGWFSTYLSDMLNVIKSNKYDVVTGMLNEDLISFLQDNKVEDLTVILVNSDSEEILHKIRQRGKNRGNTEYCINQNEKFIKSAHSKYTQRTDLNIVVLNEDWYLIDYLKSVGVNLKPYTK